MNDKLTQEQMDALREIVTIGAGNAATAFAQMIKKKVNIKVPKANFSPISKAAEILTLYPTIISIEAPISNMIAGIKKKPGIPKDSIQPTVPS